ncbi:DUF6531 domain-containing protein [Halochromatium glycolicum]|jgi:YD repeat-containing protein|nr:DUF6531 domain-containing protein [Halochromatium glycolicum]
MLDTERTRRIGYLFQLPWLALTLLCGLACVQTADVLAAEDLLPANGNIQAEAVTPGDALEMLAARAPSARASLPGLAVTQANVSDAASEAAPEIAEMARALRYNVDLIYAFVHDQVAFEPLFGARKGALGTLLDKCGNAFDQAQLMVALLRESGYTASYVQGTLRLDAQQAMDWLGLEDYFAIGNLLPSGGIPMENYYSTRVDVHHVWVKVEIAGQSYVFDPSFTNGTRAARMDLAAAMGYDAASFLAAARSGSAEGTHFIQDLNRANVRARLSDYASSLIEQIRNTTPAATLEEVIGGRAVEPAVSDLRQSTHPLGQSILAEWSGDIPAQYQTTLRIQLPGIDQTLNSSDIYGRRLTLFYNASNQPELRLDGALMDTGSAVAPGSRQSISFTIDHPYAAGGGAYGDQSGSQSIVAGGAYVISNGWGNMGKGMVDRHRQRLREYRHAGLDERSEAVLGESLALISYNWIAQNSLASELSDRIAQGETLRHHWVGIAGESSAPYVDLPFNLSSTVSLANEAETPNALFFSASGVGSALEHGVIEQTQPIGAVSTVKLLDQANDLSYKIFDVTAASFGSVQSQLQGYSASELSYVESYLNAGYRVLLPSDGDLGEAQWQGIGFLAVSPGDDRIAHIIGGGLKGGFGAESAQTDSDATAAAGDSGSDADNHVQSDDPIDLVTGDFLYASDDIGVGSGGLPVGLGLQRRYNAANRFEDRGLGWGWTHSFDIVATPGSDGYQGLGADSPVDAAAAIVAAYVSLDLLKAAKSTDRLLVAALVEKWLMDQLTDNVVNVSQPGSSQQFVKLPDGSYHASPGQSVELFQDADQTYRMRTRRGVEMRFDAAGRLATWEDPNGNRLALQYGADGLSSVTNDFGRSLTFGYVDGRLERITDDTGRQVSYAYDAAGNLRGYTDPGGKQTRFVYDPGTPGLLTQVFGPRRPSEAQVTNTYDRLGRVMTQRDAAGNLYQYFIAGHRSEEVDPLGGTRVWEFNAQGRTLLEIDPLGLTLLKRYDGEQRLIEATLPEGGRISYDYDVWHNPVRVTAHPKPGSPLSPLVRTFTYDAEYDLPLTATDPKG